MLEPKVATTCDLVGRKAVVPMISFSNVGHMQKGTSKREIPFDFQASPFRIIYRQVILFAADSIDER